MTERLIKCRPYLGALSGRGLFRRSLALFLMVGALLGVFSEVAGFMYVANDYHLVLKNSYLYASWGDTPEDREYAAQHALKRSEPYVVDLWASDRRMGLRFTDVRFDAERSRVGFPWLELFPGVGSFGLPLIWFYFGSAALVGIEVWVSVRHCESFPKCPNCNYNLTGNTSGRCPECGTAIVAHTPKLSARIRGRKS